MIYSTLHVLGWVWGHMIFSWHLWARYRRWDLPGLHRLSEMNYNCSMLDALIGSVMTVNILLTHKRHIGTKRPLQRLMPSVKYKLSCLPVLNHPELLWKNAETVSLDSKGGVSCESTNAEKEMLQMPE